MVEKRIEKGKSSSGPKMESRLRLITTLTQTARSSIKPKHTDVSCFFIYLYYFMYNERTLGYVGWSFLGIIRSLTLVSLVKYSICRCLFAVNGWNFHIKPFWMGWRFVKICWWIKHYVTYWNFWLFFTHRDGDSV